MLEIHKGSDCYCRVHPIYVIYSPITSTCQVPSIFLKNNGKLIVCHIIGWNPSSYASLVSALPCSNLFGFGLLGLEELHYQFRPQELTLFLLLFDVQIVRLF